MQNRVLPSEPSCAWHSISANRLEAPITLEVTFKSYRPAELAAYLPSVERVDAHTIRFVGADMVQVSRFLQFLGGYSAGLVP